MGRMGNSMGMNLIIVVLAAIVLFSQSVYIVEQVKQALVVRLGRPDRAIMEPGLHFKVPFIEEVHLFESRLLEFDQDPQEILSSDKKNLRVDNYTRWRISDPLKFYQTVNNEAGADARLNDIIYSNLREVLGQYTMMEIVAGARADLMDRIKQQANAQTKPYGIEIVDVRLRRTDLPVENSKAVYRRMQTERERQAKQYRAEGEKEAVKIRARANREKKIMLAEAYQKAEQLRGEGDAAAARIYAEAYGKDVEFFQFYRAMEAYRKAFAREGTLVLEPEGFFRYLQNSR